MNLIHQVMLTTTKVSRSLIFLELGFLTIEFILKQKRLNYLHNLLQMDDSTIAKQVIYLQSKSPLVGDWIKTVLEDMVELEIDQSFEEISSLSKVKWEKVVKEASQKACLASLLKDKNKLSKGKEIKYDALETQSYLQAGNNTDLDTKRKILRVRVRDIPVKGNFPNLYPDKKCPVQTCHEDETQKHVFHSRCIQTSSIANNQSIEYEEIFQNNTVSQAFVARMIFDNLESRKAFLPSSVKSGGPGEPGRGGAKATTSLVIRKAREKSLREKMTRRK